MNLLDKRLVLMFEENVMKVAICVLLMLSFNTERLKKQEAEAWSLAVGLVFCFWVLGGCVAWLVFFFSFFFSVVGFFLLSCLVNN